MKDPLRPLTEEFVRGQVEKNHISTRDVPASLRQECDNHVACSCGRFVSHSCDIDESLKEHKEHQDDMVARLLNS